MRHALVLYHSLYGNTKSVAEHLARGLEEAGLMVACLSIDDVDLAAIPDYSLVAIGSPTHMIRPSKDMREFLKRLSFLDLSGLAGFSFDTRTESRMNRRGFSFLENSAARVIEGTMKRLKMTIIRPRASALVQGTEGPLASEESENFRMIGREIGALLAV